MDAHSFPRIGAPDGVGMARGSPWASGALSTESLPTPIFHSYPSNLPEVSKETSSLDETLVSPPFYGRSRPKVLLTIPVYNEVRFLRTTVEALDLALSRSGINYILGIAEDGSTDGTKEILPRLKQEMPELEIRSDPCKLGRGKALRQFWAGFDADFYAFCDTDLATDPDTLVNILHKAIDGENIVVGSRYAAGAVVERPLLRELVSRMYNWYVRHTFRDGVLDHQCGLKVFSKKAVQELVWHTREDSWFWDTEVLVLARKRGYRVAEVPVPWVEKKTSRTSLRRLFSDMDLHGMGILRLKSELGSYDPIPTPRPAPRPTEAPSVESA